MAETFTNKYEGKLIFHLQEHGGIQQADRTLTFPLDTSTITSDDWAKIKTQFDTYHRTFYTNSSLSGFVQPTGWRDNDDSSPSTIPNTPFDVVGMEISVEHKEVFGYDKTEE